MSSGRTILKQSGISRLVPIAVWIFCVLACADAIIEGTASFAVRTVMVLAAVSLATWIVLFSPCLAVDPEGITIINPTRVVKVPFGALIEVRVGGVASVLARFAGGRERKVTSWNAPGAKRRRPTRGVTGLGGRGLSGMVAYSAGRSEEYVSPPPLPTTSEVDAAVGRFRAPWEQTHPDGDSSAVATTTWRWREWILLTLLVVANVAIRLR